MSQREHEYREEADKMAKTFMKQVAIAMVERPQPHLMAAVPAGLAVALSRALYGFYGCLVISGMKETTARKMAMDVIEALKTSVEAQMEDLVEDRERAKDGPTSVEDAIMGILEDY